MLNQKDLGEVEKDLADSSVQDWMLRCLSPAIG